MRFWVADSIGTSGGVRALADGAIDVALTTRPLQDEERFDGLRQQDIAVAALALVVDRDNPTTSLSLDQVEAIYRGETTHWPDGRPIVALVREPGDSGELAISAVRPSLFAAFEEGRRTDSALELTTDPEMRDALLAIDGSVGFLDASLVALEALPLRLVAIDGVAPSADAFLAGRYPFGRRIRALWRTDAHPAARRVVQALTGPEVREALRAGGYAGGYAEDSAPTPAHGSP